MAGTGPGTFTGLRIGLATARGLGFALGIPVRGVSTLDALLVPAGVDVACIDARRGEVFCAGAGIEPQAMTPAALAAALPAGTVVVGDGAVRYRELLAGMDVPAGRLAAARPARAPPRRTACRRRPARSPCTCAIRTPTGPWPRRRRA